MSTGVVLSVDVERYGDTLAADTSSTDLVLSVDDVVDFADEDDFAAGPQWLTIAGSAPMQYVSVDDDNDTITLALPVGAVYEAGSPVRMWDAAAGEEVTSGLCWVELDEADADDQPVPAEIRPEEMIHFGLDDLAGLIGARVEIVEDDEEPDVWRVSHIVGRAAAVDSAYVRTPYLDAELAATATLTTGTWTTLSNLTVTEIEQFEHVGSGVFKALADGLYDFRNAVTFDNASSTGLRGVRMMYGTAAGDVASRAVFLPAQTTVITVETAQFYRLVAGETVKFQGWQSSGGNLDVLGPGTGAARTAVAALRVAP